MASNPNPGRSVPASLRIDAEPVSAGTVASGSGPGPGGPGGAAGNLAWLEAWARLTAAESEAIEAGDWAHLVDLQQVKQRLRATAVPEVGDGGADGGAVARGNAMDPSVTALVAAVVAQERANLALLERRREGLEAERVSAEKARWNLRRQMGSFAGGRGVTWQQYS